ncbi:uncharacterized protein ASPGLDRAFT_43264 [Aspergillus glaucus CBS 516.65]|uniref:Life-span regulatory factor-domain-containing protein n=1 Tax=Aspergillus glaucus CBS 516.65 TaxID=1160497 RepID=A0A1L9VW62_ASPGL|nr:hypothetical protein ASPGLDRAFT_43264 [Aspergillus glaucus CBS 516.65]OJJ88136.1 hypothetical protein ASPGLDRAFT_43264 [Aspergillus glaucus CBS 516.65]
MTQSTAHTLHPSPFSSSHHHQHRRTPSNGSKLRAVRPALHRRGTTNYSIHKLGSGQAKQSVSVDDDCESEMAASFLNFCAMCERQITVPDNSLLYCSERCRRKDSCKPLSASCPSTASMPLSTSPPTSPPMSPRAIVAPMTPTRKPSAAIRIPGEHHDAKTDLDPSEWKPVIPMGSVPNGLSSLATSEAWHYLSQFHDEPMPPMRRPRAIHRTSTTSLSALSAPSVSGIALPALTSTPSTVASSFSSNASDAPGLLHEPIHHRPLPPRHSSSSVTKGVQLVVPHVKTSAEDVTAPDMSDHGSIFPASSSIWTGSDKTLTRA